MELNHQGYLIHYLRGSGSQIGDLHITVLGDIDDPAKTGLEALEPLVLGAPRGAIELIPQGVEAFGLGGEHRALTFGDPTGRLQELHEYFLTGIEELGFRSSRPQWTGPNFRPHMTLGSSVLQAASHLKLDSVTLVDSIFDGDWNFLRGEPLATVELGELDRG